MVKIKVNLPEIVEVSKYIVLLEKLLSQFNDLEKEGSTKGMKFKVAEKGEVKKVEVVQEISKDKATKAQFIENIIKNKKLDVKSMSDSTLEGLDKIVGNHLNIRSAKSKGEEKEKEKERKREEKKEMKEQKEREKKKKAAEAQSKIEAEASQTPINSNTNVTTAEIVADTINQDEINKKI